MPAYDTLSEAISALQQQGYMKDFNLKPDCLHCAADDIELRPADFDIVDVYRFEGPTDPGDEAVLYAIEGKDGSKGMLVDAYGTYAEAISPEMAEKLRYTPEN